MNRFMWFLIASALLALGLYCQIDHRPEIGAVFIVGSIIVSRINALDKRT